MKTSRILPVLALTLAASGLPLWWVAAFVTADGPMCENSILSEALAPGQELKAVVFSRSCGATTGFSTQVSVLSAHDALPDAGGNAFVADADHGLAPVGSHGGPRVRLRWEDDGQLVIAHHPLARVLKGPDHAAGVAIRHDATEPE